MKGIPSDQVIKGFQQEGPLLAVLRDILKTKEARHVLGTMVPEMVRIWAGRSPFKRMITGLVGKSILKGLSQSKDGKPADVQLLLDVLPRVIEGVFGSLRSVSETLEKMTVEDKEGLLGSFLSGLGDGRTGELLTIYARVINEVHKKDPEFLARILGPGFRRWVEKTDFGELRDFMDNSPRDISALVKMVNDVMWAYPAKVVLVLSFLPDIVNFLVLFLEESTQRFNQNSPDLIADILLSLFREIDGESLGRCINELAELLRKVHTGSALIGEPGSPQFPHDLSQFLEDALSVIDGKILGKARIALAEDREAVKNTLMDAYKNDFYQLLYPLHHYGAIRNPRIRSARYQMEAFEEVPEEEVAEAADRGFSDTDVQDMSEIVNLLALLANRIRDFKPELFSTLAVQFVDNLDFYLVQDALDGVVGDLATALRPLGRVIVPRLVNGLCDVLSPEDDEYEKDAAVARERLRSLLMGEEEVS